MSESHYFSGDGKIEAVTRDHVVRINPTDAAGMIRVNCLRVNIADIAIRGVLEEWTKVPGYPLEIRRVHSTKHFLYFEVRERTS